MSEKNCVINHFFHIERPRAHRVIWCESKKNQWVVNPRTGAAGLAQFLPSTWNRPWNPYRRYSPHNVVASIAAMEKLVYHVRGGGWSQWSCH